MGSPSHGLSTIPGGKCIGREAGMDKCEMSFVTDIIEIVEIIVHLYRSKLSLVDNVLVTQRTDVEPSLQCNSMSTLLAKDIELSFKVLFIEIRSVFRSIPGSVLGFENNDRLKNVRFFRQGRRSQDSGISRYFTPSQDSQSELLGNLFEKGLTFGTNLRIGVEEDVSNSILSREREFEVLVMFEFAFHEFVWDGCHDSGSITVSCIRTNGSTMRHVTQQVASYTQTMSV